MNEFDIVEFGLDDIVRSGLVKSYLIAKKSITIIMFEHVELDLSPLERETIDGVRYYKIPDNHSLLKLVSITSVISHYNKGLLLSGEKLVMISQ